MYPIFAMGSVSGIFISFSILNAKLECIIFIFDVLNLDWLLIS